MRFLFCVLLFLSSIAFMYSQNSDYLDSLSIAIEKLPKKEQIQIITSMPFDKLISNVKTYEVLVDKAIQYSKDIKDTFLLADSYASKTYVAGNEKGLELAFKAIRIYEYLDMSKRTAGMYISLGWQLKYRDFDKAFNYYQKGLNILEKQSDKSGIDPTYDNYGVLLGMKKQWDSALYYHEKSLKIKKQLNDSTGIPFGYSHLANVYLNQNKFNKALIYLDSALVIRQKRQDIYGITDTYLYYGDLYFVKGDYEEAISYFEKGYKLALNNSYFPLKKYAIEYLYKSNDSLQNYKEALRYNLKYNTLKDSMLNVETNNKISELEIQYQTETKEKEILTQRANLAEQKLHLSRKNTQLFGLGLLAIGLFLLGYLLYKQQRLKHNQLKKESELKEALVKIETQNHLQEQRLRISRDLHDNIGAQLTFIISSLDNLKYGFKLPDNLNSKLETISQFTTATIYELRDTIWAMNKSEISFEDLQSRISNLIEKANKSADAITFSFHVNKELESNKLFTSVQGMNIYRIIQESVNNALKYANATLIDVNFSSKENAYEMTITDNGNGFDINKITYGNGLENIKKRAHELDAELEIISSENGGTTIRVHKSVNTLFIVLVLVFKPPIFNENY